MLIRKLMLSAALSTIFPAAALAQSQEDCDVLLREIEARQGQETAVSRDQVAAFVERSDFAACRDALQQIQTQAEQGGQAPQEAGNIVVEQPAPTVTVEQPSPQITVQQPQPTVTVRQPQPEIVVRQPAPVVTIDIPQPEIIVRMPQPEVLVQQAQPQVQVEQTQPQVQVVQPEQPQVQVQEGAAPQIQLQQSEEQANVQVEQTGKPRVSYERAEPQVTINQAEGEPQVTVEQMDPREGDQPGTTASLRGREDPNTQPETQGAGEQQAANDPAQNPPPGAEGQTQRLTVAQLKGMEVVNERGEQIGEAEGVVQSASDSKMYVVVNQGGFLGLGEKKVALSMDGLMVQGNRIVVPGLTNDQITAFPDFQPNDQFPPVREDMDAEFRVMAQQ